MADTEKQEETRTIISHEPAFTAHGSYASTDPNKTFIEGVGKVLFPPALAGQTRRISFTKQQWMDVSGAFQESAFSLQSSQTDELFAHWVSTHLPTNQIEKISEVAQDVFENEAIARDWLLEPNPATDNKPPIDLLGSSDGYDRVFHLLKRIEYGNLA